MKFDASCNRFEYPSNYDWPSEGVTFFAVSFVLCSVLLYV